MTVAVTLTEKDLALRWKKSTRTLQNWRASGAGPAFICIGKRSIYYRLDAIEAFEKASTVGKLIAPEGWDITVKRAAGAFGVLAAQAKTPGAMLTLNTLRDELHALIA